MASDQPSASDQSPVGGAPSRTRIAFAVALVVVLGVLAALVVRPFASYLVAAVLLAFVLHPLDRRLAERVGDTLSAGVLVTATVLAVAGPVAVFLAAVAGDLTALAEGESALPGLEAVEQSLQGWLGVEIALRERLRSLAGQLPELLAGSAPALLGGGIHAVLGLLLLLFVEYYLLKDGASLVAWVRDVAPLPDPVGRELFDAADEMTWAVLEGHVLVAIAQGVVAGLGLIVVGIPNAVIWTIVMVVLALIPIVGVAPVLGGAGIYLLVDGRLLAAAFIVVYGLTVVALTDDYLRALLVDRRTASLHPAVILVGVLGGAVAFGAMGLFVGPVVLGLFKATVDVFQDYYDVE